MKPLLKFPSKYNGNGLIGEKHYKFAKMILQQTDLFKFQEVNFSAEEWPIFTINDKKIMFNYEDFMDINPNYSKVDICFKTQLTDRYYQKEGYENVYAWPQISFHDLNKIPNITYKAKGNLILNNQRPYGNAKDRRKNVQSILKQKYNNNVDIKCDHDQMHFFNLISNCLTYVHVPGYCNNMLDRAHVQMFALGCCMITTKIPNILPNNLRPIPNVHYVLCNDDYSDLIEKIEWIKESRDKAVEIGKNAKELFNDSMSLPALRNYFSHILL